MDVSGFKYRSRMERHRIGIALNPEGHKGRWKKILHRNSFENEELESLYQRYIYKLRLSSVVAFLVLFIVLSATLSVLNFVFLSKVTLENLYHISMCGILSLLLVYIHSRYMNESHLVVLTAIIVALCMCFSVIALPLNFGDRPRVLYTPAEGVWQITLVVFLIYALLPLKIYIAIAIGVFLPLVHVLVSVLLADDFLPMLLWRQVSSPYDVIILIEKYIENENFKTLTKDFQLKDHRNLHG